jgi:diguanylate cyclase (GGDEF)-like protein
LAHTASLGQSVAVFFFDLDGFKQVNDTLGHAGGDEVLRTVADRVRCCLRKNDTAARFGGDEFTFLIEGISTEEQVVPMAERLLLALQTPMKIDDKEVHIGGSIGIALGHPNKDNRDTILHKADLAMYQAKKRGGGNYIIFKNKM